MIIPRYATIGQDCESAQHGTIRRHQGRGLLTPTSYNTVQINHYHPKGGSSWNPSPPCRPKKPACAPSLQTILLSPIENSSYLSKLSGSFILFHLRNKSFASRKLRMILMHLLFPASSCGYVLHFLKLIASPIQFTQPVLSVYAYLRLNTQRVPTDGKHCSIRVLSLVSIFWGRRP